jgi:tetratricopeptide (TPR) repeat protein
MARVSKTAPRVDDSPLARQIGERLRRFRLEAGLTQQQLAEGRYTKAYVSALENGLSRPSMAALNFFSQRLGLPASRLINDEPAAWARLEADLALACGRWDDAVAAYTELLEAGPTRDQRAELLRGQAEALERRGKSREAIGSASEAAQLFHAAHREADAALAEYWLAAAQYSQGNPVEAQAILQGLLVRVRGGLMVEPGFQMRLLMALSSTESREGNHVAALAYLEEIRSLAPELDDRRRAAFLYDLAYSYRETGDFEAAVRAGVASLELFRRTDAERETGALENDLALSFLALGNTARAQDLAASARGRFERLGDERWLAHALDTQAQVSLARGAIAEAVGLAREALALAEKLDHTKAAVDALLTLARAETALGDRAAALAANARAGELARQIGGRGLIRKALTEWADALAASGDHERAFALMREALGNP